MVILSQSSSPYLVTPAELITVIAAGINGFKIFFSSSRLINAAPLQRLISPVIVPRVILWLLMITSAETVSAGKIVSICKALVWLNWSFLMVKTVACWSIKILFSATVSGSTSAWLSAADVVVAIGLITVAGPGFTVTFSP